jgi:hypothetical protein
MKDDSSVESQSIRNMPEGKARRKAAAAFVGAHHEEQLRLLQVRIREGLARLDGGEIDSFKRDELIHHYKRAAQKLWSV